MRCESCSKGNLKTRHHVEAVRNMGMNLLTEEKLTSSEGSLGPDKRRLHQIEFLCTSVHKNHLRDCQSPAMYRAVKQLSSVEAQTLVEPDTLKVMLVNCPAFLRKDTQWSFCPSHSPPWFFLTALAGGRPGDEIREWVQGT